MTDPRTALEEATGPVMADELVEQLSDAIAVTFPAYGADEEQHATWLIPEIRARIQSDAAEIERLRAEVAARERPDFAPCPTCHQYSHTIAGGLVEEAALFFTAMDARPGGLPGGYRHDDQTRDMAQRLIAAAADARAKAVADVAAWLRGRLFQMSLSQSDQEYARDIATALETGEWEK